MIGTLVSLWYMSLFWSIWIGYSIYQPFVYITIALVARKPKAAWYKFQMFVQTILFLTVSKDKKKSKKKKTNTTIPYVEKNNKETETVELKKQQQSDVIMDDNTTTTNKEANDDNNNNAIPNTTTTQAPTTTTTTNDETVTSTTTSAKKSSDDDEENNDHPVVTVVEQQSNTSATTKVASAPTATSTTTTTSSSNTDNATIQIQKTKKTIIFIRHGESTWNDTFNKGDRKLLSFVLNFIPNLVYAIVNEYYFWITGQQYESWFYDSPLSIKGIHQAQRIANYIQNTNVEHILPKEAKLLSILQGTNAVSSTTTTATTSTNKQSSLLVSSNLRRAISTIAIGLQDRLCNDNTTSSSSSTSSTDDTIIILPSLQEMSYNPDALCITPPYSMVLPTWTDPYTIVQSIYYCNSSDSTTTTSTTNKTKINTRYHTGNKRLFGNGYERITEFCSIVFNELDYDKKNDNNNNNNNNNGSSSTTMEEGTTPTTIIMNESIPIIACGHSLWLREFFKTYLPNDCDHIAKKKKLCNGGIVGFTLIEEKHIVPTTTIVEQQQQPTSSSSSTTQYTIDPTSIVVLLGGF